LYDIFIKTYALCLLMEKVKMEKEKETTRKNCSVVCPFCCQIIRGTSPNHLKKNLKMHIFSKHSDEEESVEVVE